MMDFIFLLMEISMTIMDTISINKDLISLVVIITKMEHMFLLMKLERKNKMTIMTSWTS